MFANRQSKVGIRFHRNICALRIICANSFLSHTFICDSRERKKKKKILACIKNNDGDSPSLT